MNNTPSDLKPFLDSNKTVAGFKQVHRGILSGEIKLILLAVDTDDDIKKQLLAMCQSFNVEIRFVLSKQELGQMIGIDVKCAVVGVFTDQNR